MPKMKTHRGAAKRVKRTGSGQLKRSRAFYISIYSQTKILNKTSIT